MYVLTPSVYCNPSRHILLFSSFWRWAIFWGKLYYCTHSTDVSTINISILQISILVGCPANLVIVELWNQRKSPETATDINNLLDRESYESEEKVREWYPTTYGTWQAEHGNSLCYLGEEEAIIYRWNWCQVDSPLTRETSGSSKGQAHSQLLIKSWLTLWVSQGLSEQRYMGNKEPS